MCEVNSRAHKDAVRTLVNSSRPEFVCLQETEMAGISRGVLTSMIVYLSMALDLPPWALKAIDKIRRGFLWKGRKDVEGTACLLGPR
jgi:hypothetical protein